MNGARKELSSLSSFVKICQTFLNLVRFGINALKRFVIDHPPVNQTGPLEDRYILESGKARQNQKVTDAPAPGKQTTVGNIFLYSLSSLFFNLGPNSSFFSRLSVRSADRRHASMKETTGPALTKVKYHEKEREAQFQNKGNWVNIRFSSREFKSA